MSQDKALIDVRKLLQDAKEKESRPRKRVRLTQRQKDILSVMNRDRKRRFSVHL